MKQLMIILMMLMLAIYGCKRTTEPETGPQDQTPTPSTHTPETIETPAPVDADDSKTEETTVSEPESGQIGCKATPLDGLEWVKGQPVTITPGNIYVVEFWATWCGPCRTSIPHLTELQKKYADRKVTFVGVSNETLDEVKPFVEEQGDKMNYAVAIDPDGKVNAGYMEAFKIGGIPNAFLVDASGHIVWQGHPMGDLESVLEQVLAGNFDYRAYEKKKQDEIAERQAAIRKAQEEFDNAIAAMDALIEKEPANPAHRVKRAETWLGESFVTDLRYRPEYLMKALEDYKTALALDPQDPLKVADDIAFFKAWQGAEDARIPALKAFVEQYPDSIRSPFAHYALYYDARTKGNLQEAVDHLSVMENAKLSEGFATFVVKTKEQLVNQIQNVQENAGQVE